MNREKAAFGPEHYCQWPGALAVTGQETVRFGKKAVIVAGKTGWNVAGKEIEKSLSKQGVAYKLHIFSGYCSQSNVSAICRKASEYGAQVIVGVGGGKALDTSKSVADLLGVRCVCVPTSIATCAAFVQLCVWYDDNGACMPSMTTKEPVGSVILDTDIIVNHCPARLTASGIADAIAKYPELDYNVSLFPLPGKSEAFEMAKTVAKRNYDFLLVNGKQAVEDILCKKLTSLVDDVIYSCVSMTGLASALVSGVRQLAVAHMFYNAVATMYKRNRDAYYHGEIVSCGITLQLYANGYPVDYVGKVVGFLKSISTPTCLSDLEIKADEENSSKLLGYILQNGFDNPVVQQRITEGFSQIKK